jgi:hypothetical protein
MQGGTSVVSFHIMEQALGGAVTVTTQVSFKTSERARGTAVALGISMQTGEQARLPTVTVGDSFKPKEEA